MRYFVYILFAVLFTACNSPKPNLSSNEVKKPYWLDENNLLDIRFVVGYAPSTFQGLYMQRQNALFDGRKKLSFNMKSIISSKSIHDVEVYQESISIKSIKNIDAFSQLILSDIKQFDAYMNENNELYLLMGLSGMSMKLESKSRYLKAFNKKRLLESKCYDKEVLNSISTSSYIYDEKPLWFYTSDKKDHYSSIGIAEKVDEDYEAQKRVALMLAKTDLIKQIKSYSSSKMQMLKILKHDESGVLLDSSSTHKSIAKVKSIKIKDIWMDPKSCELYVLIYSTK